MTSLWDLERETIIDRLEKILPYPKNWLESLSTQQLIAIYRKPNKRKDTMQRYGTPYLPKADECRKENPEDKGQILVKTDGHGWEPEFN